MKKKIIFTSLIVTLLIVMSYAITFLISITLNKEFGNKEIILSSVIDDYRIKFNKISPSLIPFSFSWKVSGYTEDNNEVLIEFISPIYIGYNFIEKTLYLTFRGEILAKYKPIQSAFGTRIHTGNNTIKIYLNSNIKLISYIFKKSKNLFELLNLINKISYEVKNFQAFDLINNEEIYNQEHELYEIKLAKHPEYQTIEDFKNNIPKKLEIYVESKTNNFSYGKRILPTNLLLGLKLPIKMQIKAKLEISTEKDKLSEAMNNFTFLVKDLKSDSSIHKINGSLLFHRVTENNFNEDIYKFSALIEPKIGFIKGLFDLLKLTNSLLEQNLGQKITSNQYLSDAMKILNSVVYNENKFSLHNLENKPYNLDIDIKYKYKPGYKLQIKNIEIKSKKTGIKITGDYELKLVDKFTNTLSTNKVNGNIAIYNYLTLINFLVDNIRPLANMEGINNNSYQVYTKSYIDFLKNISDNPTLKNSDDINIKLSLDEKNIQQNKIGSVPINNYTKLFKLELYRNIISNLANNTDRNSFINSLGLIINDNEKKLLMNIIDKPAEVSSAEIMNLLKAD